MNLEKFRITHSTLIEHYQYIESHLEGIYAVLSEETFLESLQKVERDSLNRIVEKIRKIANERNISVFTFEEYERMNTIFQRRNFWCHNCYYDLVFDRKTGGPKKTADIKAMMLDLREAEILRDELFAKKIDLLNKNNLYSNF